MRACGWQLTVVKMGAKCLKKLVLGRKAVKIERLPRPESSIFPPAINKLLCQQKIDLN